MCQKIVEPEPAIEFLDWKEENIKTLEARYRKYLKSCAEDEAFDLDTLEDFQTFIEEEFGIVLEGGTSIWECVLF